MRGRAWIKKEDCKVANHYDRSTSDKIELCIASCCTMGKFWTLTKRA
jgi:hypothetical protein